MTNEEYVVYAIGQDALQYLYDNEDGSLVAINLASQEVEVRDESQVSGLDHLLWNQLIQTKGVKEVRRDVLDGIKSTLKGVGGHRQDFTNESIKYRLMDSELEKIPDIMP